MCAALPMCATGGLCGLVSSFVFLGHFGPWPHPVNQTRQRRGAQSLVLSRYECDALQSLSQAFLSPPAGARQTQDGRRGRVMRKLLHLVYGVFFRASPLIRPMFRCVQFRLRRRVPCLTRQKGEQPIPSRGRVRKVPSPFTALSASDQRRQESCALLLPADDGFHDLAFSPFSPQPLTFITVSTD